jgi:hypothetical protein
MFNNETTNFSSGGDYRVLMKKDDTRTAHCDEHLGEFGRDGA